MWEGKPKGRVRKRAPENQRQTKRRRMKQSKKWEKNKSDPFVPSIYFSRYMKEGHWCFHKIAEAYWWNLAPQKALQKQAGKLSSCFYRKLFFFNFLLCLWCFDFYSAYCKLETSNKVLCKNGFHYCFTIVVNKNHNFECNNHYSKKILFKPETCGNELKMKISGC